MPILGVILAIIGFGWLCFLFPWLFLVGVVMLGLILIVANE